MEHVTHGITLHGIARFVDIATDALSTAREEIDALNVYPVPDGDTGTNMFLTVSAARDGLREAMAADPGIELPRGDDRAGPAALLGARGNSGVILSQMLRAFVRHLAAATAEDRRADVMATAMSAATDASYAAVGTPVEGTILSVARAASEAALEAAGSRRHAPARSCRPPPGPPGWRWRGRPSSSRCWPRRVWSTRVVAACASSSMPPRRPRPGVVRRRTPLRSAPTTSRWPSRPTT